MFLDLIRDTEIYQIIWQEGYQKGLQLANQRSIQNFQEIILKIFQRDFPELTTLATERISTIFDLELLKRLIFDVTAAKSVEQVRDILDTLVTNE